jgi:hypothetical protein
VGSTIRSPVETQTLGIAFIIKVDTIRNFLTFANPKKTHNSNNNNNSNNNLKASHCVR